MSTSQFFLLSPLSRALKLLPVVPFLIISEQAQATRFIDGSLEPEATIDGSTAPDNYVVFNNATLNANGAQTRDIRMTGSTLNLTGSQVNAVGAGATGVHLESSLATIIGSTITSDDIGLVLSHDAANTKGSTAHVSSSNITGARNGATVNGLSVLNLSSSTVVGTTQAGIRMFDGTVNAADSTIVGGTVGIQLYADPGVDGPNTLNLSNTRVEGLNGSALLVDNAEANIAVLNNSTLVGSNGVLMELTNGAEGNLRVGRSHLVGDIIADGTSTANVTLEDFATLTGRLENVENLAVNSSARWVMVGDGSVENLTLNGGGIQFGNPGEYFKLSVDTLSGAGGTFYMHNNFATGQISTLTVTGTASGDHKVALNSSGSEPTAAGAIPVVNIGGGDARFTLLNGPVDLGAFSYDLIKVGNNDWYLNTATRAVSPSTKSVMALFNTAPTVWYGELSTLRSRMGEVRMDQGKAGGWIRAYGNKFDVSASSGVAYQQNQQGLSFGADAPLPIGDGQWLVGLLGGYSKSDLDLSRGSNATVNSYYLGAYTTWLDESGYYFDGILKYNRFQNKSDVQLSDSTKTKGHYNNSGIGASLEFGRQFKLADDYFIEPFTQWSGVIIQGKGYDLDNGLSADGDRTQSLLGKVGATAGRNFNLGEGKVVQPYVRAAYVHEFANNNKVEVNSNVFNNDLSGSRGELGAGLSMTLTDKVSVHADFEYSNGEKIEQPWGANVGARYNF